MFVTNKFVIFTRSNIPHTEGGVYGYYYFFFCKNVTVVISSFAFAISANCCLNFI